MRQKTANWLGLGAHWQTLQTSQELLFTSVQFRPIHETVLEPEGLFSNYKSFQNEYQLPCKHCFFLPFYFVVNSTSKYFLPLRHIPAKFHMERYKIMLNTMLILEKCLAWLCFHENSKNDTKAL